MTELASSSYPEGCPQQAGIENLYAMSLTFEASSLFAPLRGSSYAEIRLGSAIRLSAWNAILRELTASQAFGMSDERYTILRECLVSFFNEQNGAWWWIEHKSWFLPEEAIV